MTSQMPTIKCSQILSLSAQLEDEELLQLINKYETENKFKFNGINNNSKNLNTINKKNIFLKLLKDKVDSNSIKQMTEININDLDNLESGDEIFENETENEVEVELEDVEETEEEEDEEEAEEEEDVIETVKNKILSSRKSEIEAEIEKKNALYKMNGYKKLYYRREELKKELVEIETEIENKYKTPAREIEREIEKLKKVEPAEMKDALFELMCEADDKEERLKIKELLKQIETEISKPQPKKVKRGKDRTDATYPKCPNGCGAKRNKLSGFKSHLGYGENPVKNCRKLGTVIKTESQLIEYWDSLKK